MLIILSPSKDMLVDTSYVPNNVSVSKPLFIDEPDLLMAKLKMLNPIQIAEIMNISERLAIINHQRILKWEKKGWERGGPAILSYVGEAYRGLNAKGLQHEDLLYAQKTLRILSGLYGVLRPLDSIQEHRLEMGTKHFFDGKKSLYQFWESKITQNIDHAVAKSPGTKVLVNLASEEYSSAICFNKLKHETITPVFKQEVNGKLKIVTVYTKRARGLMSRFVIENRIENHDELKAFNSDGYYYDPSLSTNEKMLFTR